ncbi:MAG TPA: DUF2652 domain-containing protein [Rhabdochlamydiaceae bacterium]|nr:DUF2652 domain-containing protein [Rhabdochlamydiaceae bacterium]
MKSSEREMFFFIADISGYTNYMIQNQMDYTHGTLIVMQLLEALIKEVKIPLEIAKLEGDAIFMYLLKENMPKEYRDNPLQLGKKLIQLFNVFYTKLGELENSTDCKCGGCSNIHQLKLKIVAHFGKATIDKIGTFQELSGVDVIIAHRLLKNSIKEKCYLLMTDPLFKQLSLPPEGRLIESTEEDKDLGKIQVHVYFPILEKIVPQEVKPSFFNKLKLTMLLHFGNLLFKLHVIKEPHFHNFPTTKDKIP